MNLSDKFVDLILSLSQKPVSPDVEDKIRYNLLDTIGVTIAGSKALSERDFNLINLLDSKEGEFKPIGLELYTSMETAIFINGINAHYLELDDGIRFGVIHPSAPLFSALIPIAKRYKVNWSDFVKGVIAGYETEIRLAYSMQPSHYSKGYHPTAICSIPGIAVGIAIMLGWEKETIKDALSAACVSVSGTLKVLDDISELKPYNCGKSAINGFYAAMLAKSGFKGPKDCLGGDTGFLAMNSDNYNKEILLEDKNFFYLEKIYHKIYASCRHTHPEIEACIKIRNYPEFNFNKISGISVKTYKGVIGKHDINIIHGESEAKMSIPYATVIALKTGKAGIEEFNEPFLSDPTILEHTRNVLVEDDEVMSCQVPNKRIAKVKVKLSDGCILSEKVEFPKGEPENPVSKEEITNKFMTMISYGGLSKKSAFKIYDNIIKSKTPNISEIW